MPVVFPASPPAPGVTPFEFPRGAAPGPKYTAIRRLHLTGGTHEEPPDPGHVRFYYVLQGEGTVLSGETQGLLRPGSAVLLAPGESLHLSCVLAPFSLLCVAVTESPRPAGQTGCAPC
jgi:mannose-6-phosphate isomerase-like protein (cupin superfamily)